MWVNLGVGCSPDRGCIELSKAPIVLRKSWLYRLHAAKPNGILLLNIGRNFFFFFSSFLSAAGLQKSFIYEE